MTATSTVQPALSQPVVSQEEWLRARRALLEQEKALTRQRDELSRKRRELPWVKVGQNYVFDGPDGAVTLADLFGRHSQLIVYHFMFGPDWPEGCKSCSLAADTFTGAAVHLAHRDTALVMISRAPIEKIEAFRQRMGWSTRWVSSYGNSFNLDYHVSFPQHPLKAPQDQGEVYYNFGMNRFPSEEGPGASVFYKDESGSLFHTYSVYARGLEPLLGVYDLLDMTPKGRDEDQLPYTMAWVRHHDRYPDTQAVQAVKTCCHPERQS